jgi:hypothetical protein
MLIRIVAQRPYRLTLYLVFALAAVAAIWRAAGGHGVQVLPPWGAVLGLYGAAMALRARDFRCRVIYACFGAAVALAFGRGLLSSWLRPVSLVELAACCALIIAAASLSRDAGLRRQAAVLESGSSPH